MEERIEMLLRREVVCGINFLKLIHQAIRVKFQLYFFKYGKNDFLKIIKFLFRNGCVGDPCGLFYSKTELNHEFNLTNFEHTTEISIITNGY